MKFELSKEATLPLLERKRVTGFLEYDQATPSLPAVRKLLAEQLKHQEDLIVIKHLYTRFGMQRAKVIAHFYDNKQALEKLEEKHTLIRHMTKEQRSSLKKAQAPAEKK